MADGSMQIVRDPVYQALDRLVAEFDWITDKALERISDGAASGFIKPSLAASIIEARRATTTRI